MEDVREGGQGEAVHFVVEGAVVEGHYVGWEVVVLHAVGVGPWALVEEVLAFLVVDHLGVLLEGAYLGVEEHLEGILLGQEGVGHHIDPGVVDLHTVLEVVGHLGVEGRLVEGHL